MIRSERLTATLDGEFVVFLIGMRINNPLKVHKWLPVARAMPKMINELYRHPELGFIHTETWFSRTIILVRSWEGWHVAPSLRREAICGRQAGRAQKCALTLDAIMNLLTTADLEFERRFQHRTRGTNA